MWRDEETEPLASSLHLSLSAPVEHSRDTDTLLNTLKISEEARIEEQSRSMQLQAKLIDKQNALQDLQRQCQNADRARTRLEHEQARLISELGLHESCKPYILA